MAITASSVLSNIRRLLQDEALQLYEKEKLLSETYTFSHDFIANKDRHFPKKLLLAYNGAVLQFPVSETSRVDTLILVRK